MVTRKEFYAPLHWFANEMDRELSQPENIVKGHWRDESQYRLLVHLKEEVAELEHEIWHVNISDTGEISFNEGKNEAIISEAADVANLALMIADNARAEKEKLALELRRNEYSS